MPASALGHEFRCWFPVGTPEGAAALERNRVAAETALLTADAATQAAAASTGIASADPAPGPMPGPTTGGSISGGTA
jgi:hypothetical protein